MSLSILIKNSYLFIVLILFFIPCVFALTATSADYSIGRFSTGVQASNVNSADLTGRAILVENAGTRNAENNELTANIGFWSNTPYHVSVSITSYSIYPGSAVNGSIIKLSISAVNSQSVWAVLTTPTGIQENITLTNNGDTYYTANSIGVYNVTFYANSSKGSLASVIDTFEITSLIIPIIIVSGSSGSGGTRTIVENCTYIWDCTSWNICSDKTQIRECKNIGTCVGTEGKPIEKRECSDALFDVVMTLNKVEIVQNEKLKFSVDLTETKGIEKIDVQIKYSIIDENNNEIFSQIETRAIQGNLSYEKELNEIKLNNGEYTLRIDILYGNLQRAFAEQRVKVESNKLGVIEIPKLTEIDNFRVFFTIVFKYLVILGVILIIGLVLWKLKSKIVWKKEQKNTINSLYGLEVYAENGHRLGNVKEVYLEDITPRIYGLLIELDKKVFPQFENRNVLINYSDVKAVGEAIMVRKRIYETISKKSLDTETENKNESSKQEVEDSSKVELYY